MTNTGGIASGSTRHKFDPTRRPIDLATQHALLVAHKLEVQKQPKTKTAKRNAPSEQQIRCLRLVAQGYSNDEIGRELFVTENTVRTHLKKLSAFLGAKNRAHAVAIAYREGYLK